MQTDKERTHQEHVKAILDDLRSIMREPTFTVALCSLISGRTGSPEGRLETVNATESILSASRGVLNSQRIGAAAPENGATLSASRVG